MYAFFLNFQIKISFLLDFLTETQKRLDLPLFSPLVLQSQPVFFLPLIKALKHFFKHTSNFHFVIFTLFYFTWRFYNTKVSNSKIQKQNNFLPTTHSLHFSTNRHHRQRQHRKEDFFMSWLPHKDFSASCCRIAGRSPPPLLLARPHKRLSHNSYSSMVAGDYAHEFSPLGPSCVAVFTLKN